MAIPHTYITKNGSRTDHSFTRGKAIRQKCLDCTCWHETEIRLCTMEDCALHPFRMGNVKKALDVSNLKPTEKI